MAWNIFKKTTKKFLGIDIGTSSIKIVELSNEKDKITLENYGQLTLTSEGKEPFMVFEKSALLLSDENVADNIGKVLVEAKINTKDALFSIPDFSTFFTFFELPLMNKQELASAIQFEARQHIPIPLSEVVLDWSVVEDNSVSRNKTKTKILLVAVPFEIINQYQEISKMSQLRPVSLEAEIFALLRALGKNKKGIIGLIDIGAQSTTFNIIENGKLKMTHSSDISGNELTKILSKSLNMGYNESDELKKKYGVRVPEMPVGKVLTPLVDLLVNEIKKVSQNYHQVEGKEPEKIILSGGSALLPGLSEYVANNLKKPVEIGNPFLDISCPAALEDTLLEMGPSFAIAVGMALRGFE